MLLLNCEHVLDLGFGSLFFLKNFFETLRISLAFKQMRLQSLCNQTSLPLPVNDIYTLSKKKGKNHSLNYFM